MKSDLYLFYIFFVLIGTAFFSCSKSTLNDEVDSSELTTRSSSETMKRGTLQFSISEKDGAAYIAMHYPDKEFSLTPIIQGGDTLLYICNFKEGGWILLAGDKRSRPILGDCETEHLSLDEVPEGIRVWLESCCDDIKYFKYSSGIQSNSYTVLWDALFPKHRKIEIKNDKSIEYKWGVFKYVYPIATTSSTIISHLTETSWGQRSPWNSKLPTDLDTLYQLSPTSSPAYLQCPTGSAAVAIAQLLYYTHYHLGKPNGLYHSIQVSQPYVLGYTTNIGFSRGDYIQNSSRWDSMPLDSMPPGTPLYTEDLMLDIGNRLGVEYSGILSRGAPSLYVLATYYSLSGEMDSYQDGLVRNSLEDEMPVIIDAYRHPYGRRHIWLIDGVYRSVVEYEMMVQFEYSENWMYADEYYDTFDELRQHYHTNDGTESLFFPYGFSTFDYWLMNWGYDGAYYNGHYSISNSASWEGYGFNKTIYYGFE